ncbi:MAG TPA: N-acetylmuramoyl-L-alanine amidase [Terrimicrobiaceae bacterium]
MKKARCRRHILKVSRLSLSFAAFLIAILLGGCASPYRQGAGKFNTVVVDAGHGGLDLGGRSVSGSPEKVVALDTARRLAAILRRKGFRVIETRTRDVFVPLGSRSAVSNSTRNCIFVSIHYNWAPRRGARGVEVYYSSPRSWRLASNILRETGKAYPTHNRGVKRANFYVLRTNRRPAVLCELGFLSNAGDNRFAQSALSRQRLAECVANGIIVEQQSAQR